jgi:protein gp37
VAEGTGVDWAHDTHNPWWGCTEVSPACDHCYAREWDSRFGGKNWGKDAPRRFFDENHWRKPLRWNKEAAEAQAMARLVGQPLPRRYVFCASMADVFEHYTGGPHDILEPWRLKLWALIKSTPALTWLLLTKRPQNIERMAPAEIREAHNAWFGTTVESPEFLWRLDALSKNAPRAPVRFVSMEPILARTSVAPFLSRGMTGTATADDGINWVILGSESGDGARPTDTDSYRLVISEAREARVPVFMKQAEYGAPGISVRPPGAPSEAEAPKWQDQGPHPAHVKRDLRMAPDGMRRMFKVVKKPYIDGQQIVEYPA